MLNGERARICKINNVLLVHFIKKWHRLMKQLTEPCNQQLRHSVGYHLNVHHFDLQYEPAQFDGELPLLVIILLLLLLDT